MRIEFLVGRCIPIVSESRSINRHFRTNGNAVFHLQFFYFIFRLRKKDIIPRLSALEYLARIPEVPPHNVTYHATSGKHHICHGRIPLAITDIYRGQFILHFTFNAFQGKASMPGLYIILLFFLVERKSRLHVVDNDFSRSILVCFAPTSSSDRSDCLWHRRILFPIYNPYQIVRHLPAQQFFCNILRIISIPSAVEVIEDYLIALQRCVTEQITV